MAEGVAVNAVPFVADERGDEQQQGALRLVEVGDDALCDFGTVCRQDDEACGGAQQVGALCPQVVLDSVQESSKDTSPMAGSS